MPPYNGTGSGGHHRPPLGSVTAAVTVTPRRWHDKRLQYVRSGQDGRAGLGADAVLLVDAGQDAAGGGGAGGADQGASGGVSCCEG